MQLIDLSLAIDSDMPRFGGTPPVYVAHSHRLDEAGFRMCTVLLGNHAGTHLDAPAHFLADGKTVENVQLERCIGEAIVLDLSDKASSTDPITVDDLIAAGAESITGCRLLIRTDWDRHFGDPGYFTDFPPLAPETAGWFASEGVWLVGVDLPTLHQTEFARMHETMLSADIAIIESLANLRLLSQPRVFFSGLPIKLAGADGAPVRAVAYDGPRAD